MFRVHGFIVGSIAAFAVLVMLVGIPSFRSGDETDKSDRFDVVIQQLKDKQRAAAEAAEPVPAEADGLAADTGEQAAAGGQSAGPGAARNTGAAAQEEYTGGGMREAADAQPLAARSGETGPPPTGNPPDDEPAWQPFWNPFRSEIAARGFVSRLEDVTGLDYRVVKVKTGVYEVAFSYHDDDERSSKLSQIAAATGLDLADAGQ